MSEDEYEEFEDFIEDYEIDEDYEPAKEPPLPDQEKFIGQGSAHGTARLLEDLRGLTPNKTKEHGFTAEIVNENLYHWHVKLFGFPADSKLSSDMRARGVDHILLEITFPEDYPYQPPFVRVVRPKFRFLSGHVTIGGAICMQLLCRSGWSAAYSLESIILQIKSEMVDPSGEARLDPGKQPDYTMAEAKEAFQRFAAKHGW